MSIVVDNACTQIWETWASGASAASLRVSPAVYPLMLLGLPLVADHEVATYDPVVVRKGTEES